jgi:uncharacterized membrane protein YphA (DoxX/SURF4 family)
MKRTTILEVIALLFVFLFLYTAVSKLMDFSVFKAQLSESPVLRPVAGIITWALPLTEVLVSFFLFSPRWRLKAFYACLVLMLSFTGYIIAILTFSKHLPCSCGGVLAQLSWRDHLIFNAVFIALSVVGIFLGERLRRESGAVPSRQ